MPKQVRDAIGAMLGDFVLYEIEGGIFRLRRVDRCDVESDESLNATLDEWSSDEDKAAFRDL